MAKNLMAVSIGNHTVRLVDIKKSSKRNVTVRQMDALEISQSFVQDGQILDVKGMAGQIRARMEQKHYKAKKILFSVNSKRIASKEIKLPYVKDKKRLQDILFMNIADYFPMNNMADYVYAYSILENVHTEDTQNYRLSVVAVPKSFLETYYELAKELNMPIEAIDYSGNSIVEFLLMQMDEGVSMVLQIGDRSTHVNIMSGKAMLLQRSIPYGVEEILENASESLGLTYEETKAVFAEESQYREKVTKEIYREAVGYLLNNLSRIVEYHTTRNPLFQVENIKLMGTGSNLCGIREELESILELPVQKIEELKGITVKRDKTEPEYTTDELLSAAVCIGAGFHPLRIALGNEMEQKREQNKAFRNIYICMGVAGGIALLACGYQVTRYVLYYQQAEELNSIIEQKQPYDDILKEYQTAKDTYGKISGFYETTKNPNEGFYAFLNDLEECMPENTGITGITAASGAVSITAVTNGKVSLAEFVMQLKELPYLSDVFVSNVSETYDEFGNPEATFNMTAVLGGEGDDSENE